MPCNLPHGGRCAQYNTMKEIWRYMKKYEGIYQKYEGIMSKIWSSMKKYVNILDLALPYLYGPWDLEKFHARASSWWALGLGKISIFSFPFLRLQPVGEAPSVSRCEVSLFCLLHISSKLFLLTYSSKPRKCECLGRWLPQTRAESTQHVNSL